LSKKKKTEEVGEKATGKGEKERRKRKKVEVGMLPGVKRGGGAIIVKRQPVH